MSPAMDRAAAALLCVWLGAHPAAAIVGGIEEPAGLARSTAMILSSRGGVCSAVVIAPTALLTAAHCVTGADLRIHWREGAEPVLVEPAAVAVNPGYDPNGIKARRRSIDLALVRTRQALPARFVPASLGGSPVPAGQPVAIGGYGVAREGDARSTGSFRTATLGAIEPYGPSRVLLWLEDPAKGGRGACTGDSGGPAALQDGSVVAVLAWAAGAGRNACGGRSQGVLVGPERNWIDRTLEGWSARASWR